MASIGFANKSHRVLVISKIQYLKDNKISWDSNTQLCLKGHLTPKSLPVKTTFVKVIDIMDHIDRGYLAQNKAPWMYAIFCTLLGLSITVFGLRCAILQHSLQNIQTDAHNFSLYCRWRYFKSLQPSDYLMMVVMVSISCLIPKSDQLDLQS